MCFVYNIVFMIPCRHNSRSNICRQESAVYFQFGVTELKDSMGYRERTKGLHRIGEISATKQNKTNPNNNKPLPLPPPKKKEK